MNWDEICMCFKKKKIAAFIDLMKVCKVSKLYLVLLLSL